MIHTPPIPPPTQLTWAEVPLIKGSGQEPDRWITTKRTQTGIVVHEVEFHSASIIRGQKARGSFSCSVTIQPPTGWVLVHDCDTPLPLVWHPMKAAMRRLAMYPQDRPDLRNEALNEAAMPYTAMRWNRGRLAYGPCNISLPLLTPQQQAQEANKIAGWLARYRQILSQPGATGSVEDSEEGIFVRTDGWTPLGIAKRGQEGGSGVFFYDGYEQAPLSPAYHWLKARCAHERGWHAYNGNNGQVVTAEFYGDPGPMYQAGTSDPNNGWLPEFAGVAASHDPVMETIDQAHGVRCWSDIIALSEMTDSPAVRRMLHSVAAQLRLQLSDIGPHPTANYTPPSLRTFRDWAKNSPHQGHFGMDTGRQLGWDAYPIAQSVKRAGATENMNWCRMFAEFVETAMMPNGLVSRCAYPAPQAGQSASVWYDPVHDLAHAFEVPILMYGAVGCSIRAKRPIANVLRFAEALYIEAPLLPYYNGHGPPQYAWVAARGGSPYPTITGGKGNTGDSSHSHAGCALAAHLDPVHRQKWIDAALRIESISDLRKDAGIIAQIQRA